MRSESSGNARVNSRRRPSRRSNMPPSEPAETFGGWKAGRTDGGFGRVIALR